MRKLLTGHAVRYNRRHHRHGHLFQNRYKSILCEEDPYLLELIRYIHLNPVRASLVKDIKSLHSYPRSGHSVLMGRRKYDWQDSDYVLGLFGATARAARKKYAEFVAKGFSQGRRPDLVGGGLIRSYGGWTSLKIIRSVGARLVSDERILGSSTFVEAVLKRANEAYEKKTLVSAKGLNLDKLIEKVTDYFDIDAKLIKSSSRQRIVARARSIVCYLAIDQLKLSGMDVAKKLNLSPSAASKLANRGRKENPIKEIEDHIYECK